MSERIHTRGGRLTSSGTAALDRVIDALTEAPEKKILLHVHGGLVSAESAERTADLFDQPLSPSNRVSYVPLEEAGWIVAHPIWHSGFVETVKEDWARIVKNILIGMGRDIVMRWLRRKVGLSSEKLACPGTVILLGDLPDYGNQDVAIAPIDEIEARLTPREVALTEEIEEPGPGDELYDLLASDPDLEKEAERIVRAIERSAKAPAELQPNDAAAFQLLADLDRELVETIKAQAEISAFAPYDTVAPLWFAFAKAGYRSLKRFRRRRDHGIPCTLVEELSRTVYADLIGSEIWGSMKTHAEDHFARDGAFTKLFDSIAEIAAGGHRVRVLVACHSAGSIMACRLVEAAATLPPGVTIDLVFEAPAVRIERFAETLKSSARSMDNIRIFTMDDTHERADALNGTIFGRIYPRSLLYLISGALESTRGDRQSDATLLGLQRHLALLDAKWLNQSERDARDVVARILTASPSRVVYSPNANGGGLGSTAREHGGFSVDPATVESVRHIALEGF